MATIAPGTRKGDSYAAITRATTPTSEQLSQALRPWRRRFTLQQALRWTGRGLIAGLIFACLLLLISRLLPWATAQYWATGLGIACLVIAFGTALWDRPTFTRTARLVDRQLALHDRLGTAWELRTESSPLLALQRRDALKQLHKHTPATSVSLRPGRAPLLVFGILAITLALLVLLPNPMTAVLQQQAAFQAHIAKQVAAIDKVRTTLPQQTSLTPQQQAQLDKILRDLEAKLQTAKNEAQAQQAIAEAQAKLDQLRDPYATDKALAHTAASTSLQNSSNSTLSALGKALASNDSKALAAALKNLASQISSMTPAQRAQLASQIEEAANQASKNPTLSAALHQLAKAVANGNSSDITDASNAVQAAASQDATTQAQTDSINSASQALQQAANSFASSTDSSTTQGQQGQGQTQGQGQQDQGQQGQGNNQGQTQGGQGHSNSGGTNGPGNKSGQNEQVFVPGQIGSGNSQQTNGGDNGVVQPGTSVPYSQVIERYIQMAHDSIDNSSVSPDLKDLVHGYFDTLSGQ